MLDTDLDAATLPALLSERVRRDPDSPLVIWEGEAIGARRLDAQANRIARGLMAAGLGRGERCAVMMTNSPDYIATWIGIAKAGGVEVPLNTAYRGDILRHVLRTAECSLVVADAAFLPVLAEVLPDCPKVTLAVVRGEPAGALAVATRSFADLAHADGSDPGVPVHFADPACILFTSGTTGPSKGAVISHRHEVAFGTTFRAIVDMKADDIAYNFLPFFHVAGKFIFMAAVMSGGSMVLKERFSLTDFWRDIRANRCTLFTAVGGVCNMLYGQPPQPDDADNPLRIIYAVPIPHEIQAQFQARFGVAMVEGYGSTECNIVSWTPPEGAPHGSCGRPSPLYEVRVVDAFDRELPPGEPGEVVVRGRGPFLLMEGYYGMPAATVAAFRNHWFHTGDRGRFDADGWLYFMDRIKDSIRRRGENISSYEVEQVVLRHPEVVEAAAVAVPSDLQEDEIKLVVVLREGARLSEPALLEWCAAQMPYFMVPRFIEFRQLLPRTPTQKIRKVELRDEGVGAGVWDCEKAGWRISRTGVTRRSA